MEPGKPFLHPGSGLSIHVPRKIFMLQPHEADQLSVKLWLDGSNPDKPAVRGFIRFVEVGTGVDDMLKAQLRLDWMAAAPRTHPALDRDRGQSRLQMPTRWANSSR